MSAPDPAIVAKVGQWVRYADEDLRLARHALTLSSGSPHRLIAYHAQQCAEKYLKGYLVWNGVDFPYTHNIARLLELCAPAKPWVDTLSEAEELTPFAITTRYPGDSEEVSRPEALRAIDVAARVREVVRAALATEGAPMGTK